MALVRHERPRHRATTEAIANQLLEKACCLGIENIGSYLRRGDAPVGGRFILTEGNRMAGG